MMIITEKKRQELIAEAEEVLRLDAIDELCYTNGLRLELIKIALAHLKGMQGIPEPVDGWHESPGKNCPVDSTTHVDIRFRDGTETDGLAGWYHWYHAGSEDDIVAWRYYVKQ